MSRGRRAGCGDGYGEMGSDRAFRPMASDTHKQRPRTAQNSTGAPTPLLRESSDRGDHEAGRLDPLWVAALASAAFGSVSAAVAFAHFAALAFIYAGPTEAFAVG
jgi:hypothetical protein